MSDKKNSLELAPGERHIDAAERLVSEEKGDTFFPSANGPLTWTRAGALAQVSMARSMERIADALELILRERS